MTVNWRRSAASSDEGRTRPVGRGDLSSSPRFAIFEDSLSRSQRQAELFEIGLRQLRQNIGLDFILPKDALILGKLEAP